MNADKSVLRKRRGETIDWTELRAHIDDVKSVGDPSWIPGAEETARILAERALALSLEPGKTKSLESSFEVIEFGLAHERYGIESSHVREVYPLENLTPLPSTPTYVLGIVNLRGEIVSVVDLRKFFDLPLIGLPDLNKVIVLESASMVFGILADVVHGVRRISKDEIQPTLPTLTGIREKYLKGITMQRTVILDAAKLLTDGDMVVQQ